MKGKWIKVTDRLPRAMKGWAVSDMVLVAWFGGTSATVADYNHKTQTWLSRDNKLVVGVTHWMPIELPEEE